MPEHYALEFAHSLPAVPQQLPLPALSAERAQLDCQLALRSCPSLHAYLGSGAGKPDGWLDIEEAREFVANLRDTVLADPDAFRTAQALLEELYVLQEQTEWAAHHGAGWRLVLTGS